MIFYSSIRTNFSFSSVTLLCSFLRPQLISFFFFTSCVFGRVFPAAGFDPCPSHLSLFSPHPVIAEPNTIRACFLYGLRPSFPLFHIVNISLSSSCALCCFLVSSIILFVLFSIQSCSCFSGFYHAIIISRHAQQ